MSVIRPTLKEWLRMIDNDECDEGKIVAAASRVNAESKGYFDENSFVTYDEGMRMLGICTREKFKKTMDDNGCKCHTVNNRPVGYLRSDIEKIIHNARMKK